MKGRDWVSLWDMTAVEGDGNKAVDPCGDVDVVIVGGGYTGLSTALHAAERGLHCQVIEAEHIGFGGSGRNVGHVNPGVWLAPDKVMKLLGAVHGQRFLRIFSDAPQTVFDLIEKHQIQCEATRNGTIHAAHSSSGFRELAGRHEQWKRLGAPVELLGKKDIADRIGTNWYCGGLLDRRAGTINPMGYCRGLARAAQAAGARISTGTRALHLHQEDGEWRVETSKGALRARNVVLGTNAYTDGLWSGLGSVYYVIHYFQVATKPLGQVGAHILSERQGLWDTCPIMFNFRRDGFGRLLIGSMGRVFGDRNRGLTQRWALKRINRIFPELGGVDLEIAWHGKIAMTSDHLPRICQLARGLWTAIGYNGRGITTGTVLGKALADVLTGADAAELPLPVSGITPAPQAEIRTRLYDLAFTANQFRKAFS